jgi:hypothetical protein
MIITKDQFYEDNSKLSIINKYTNVKVPGDYIRLFESIENSTIDYDVQKYHELMNNIDPLVHVGHSDDYYNLFHSDKIILQKVLQFKGKKFVLLKNSEIACVFDDLNLLIQTLFELDFNKINSHSPVNTILDADTGQAVFLFYTEPYDVYSNF